MSIAQAAGAAHVGVFCGAALLSIRSQTLGKALGAGVTGFFLCEQFQAAGWCQLASHGARPRPLWWLFRFRPFS